MTPLIFGDQGREEFVAELQRKEREEAGVEEKPISQAGQVNVIDEANFVSHGEAPGDGLEVAPVEEAEEPETEATEESDEGDNGEDAAPETAEQKIDAIKAAETAYEVDAIVGPDEDRVTVQRAADKRREELSSSDE